MEENDIKYDDRYTYAINKGLLCITDGYVNFEKGKLYPIHWDIRGNKKNRCWCDPYILDKDEDNMPIKYLINKKTKWRLVDLG